MFLGTYSTAIDDKARLTLPDKWRTELAQGMVITRGPDQCLLIYPYAEFASMAQKVQELGVEGGDARLWTRFLSGLATDMQLDRHGRICLSEPLRQFAQLGDAASLVGVLNRIEVWNPDQFAQVEREQMSGIAQIAERLHGRLRPS